MLTDIKMSIQKYYEITSYPSFLQLVLCLQVSELRNKMYLNPKHLSEEVEEEEDIEGITSDGEKEKNLKTLKNFPVL